MTLVDFLLARIAEDEAAARACDPTWWPVKLDDSGVGADDEGAYFAQADLLNSMTPARILAECQAKRRIAERTTRDGFHPWPLELLATAYADHPDYREDWWS